MRRISRLTTVGILAAACLQAAHQTVTAYVSSDVGLASPALYMSECRAAKVFSEAGIQIKWRLGTAPSYNDTMQRVVQVRIVSRAPDSANPGALAVALPYEGIHLTIFYDRVTRVMPEAPQVLLGYVLVHEITHLLEGFSRHSFAGVMKGNWDRMDGCRMRNDKFFLSAEDTQLIHIGIAARAARTQIASSLPSERSPR